MIDYIVHKSGYAVTKDHKYVHRLVVERVLGRKLKTTEIVHHVDENKLNNDPFNLVLCQDQAYHKILHARAKVIEDGYRPDLHAYCQSCKRYMFIEAFPKNKARWNGIAHMCRVCSASWMRGKKYAKNGLRWRLDMEEHYRQIKRGTLKREICWLGKHT